MLYEAAATPRDQGLGFPCWVTLLQVEVVTSKTTAEEALRSSSTARWSGGFGEAERVSAFVEEGINIPTER